MPPMSLANQNHIFHDRLRNIWKKAIFAVLGYAISGAFVMTRWSFAGRYDERYKGGNIVTSFNDAKNINDAA